MGTNRPGFDTDDAANALFSVYFHCERNVVADALRATGREVAEVPRDVLPTRYRILPMPLAVDTLKKSNPHPEILAFAISILVRSLPATPDDVSATPVGVAVLELVDALIAQVNAQSHRHRLTSISPQLSDQFRRNILGKLGSGQRGDERSEMAYQAIWGKPFGEYQLKIGSSVTRP